MKSKGRLTGGVFYGLVSVLLFSGLVFAVWHGRLIYQDVEAQSKQVVSPPGPLVYVPPKVDAPAGRVGGGTRGWRRHTPGQGDPLVVLAPDHVGLTVSEQPSLYWYLSRTTTAPIELTVRSEQAVEPLLETRLKAPTQPGIQRVQLADYGIHLSPSVVYRWSVTVVAEGENGSQNRARAGMIKHVKPPEELQARLDQAYRTQLPYIFAEAGFWYDAMAAISELVETTPDDVTLRQQRTALMEQAGLSNIAMDERQR